MVEGLSSFNVTLVRVEQIKARLQGMNGSSGSSFDTVLNAQCQTPPAAVRSEWDSIIQESASANNLDPALVKSVIQAESNFNSCAISRTGAKGLMQLMPSTAQSLGVSNVFDPQENISAGSRYLRQMLDRFNGNTSLALAAYNAGPNAVQRYGGIPPFPETQQYVRRVEGLLSQYRNE